MMRKLNEILLLPVKENFIVISAFRQGGSAEMSNHQHEQLRFNLTNLDYKVFELRASYCTAPENTRNAERLFFIPNARLYDGLLLGKKYYQSALLYKAENKISVSDTEVGREMWTYNFCNSITGDDFKTALEKYLSIKNGQGILRAIAIEKLHIPTRLESLLRLKNKQGLAQAEWVKLC